MANPYIIKTKVAKIKLFSHLYKQAKTKKPRNKISHLYINIIGGKWNCAFIEDAFL